MARQQGKESQKGLVSSKVTMESWGSGLTNWHVEGELAVRRRTVFTLGSVPRV